MMMDDSWDSCLNNHSQILPIVVATHLAESRGSIAPSANKIDSESIHQALESRGKTEWKIKINVIKRMSYRYHWPLYS